MQYSTKLQMAHYSEFLCVGKKKSSRLNCLISIIKSVAVAKLTESSIDSKREWHLHSSFISRFAVQLLTITFCTCPVWVCSVAHYVLVLVQSLHSSQYCASHGIGWMLMVSVWILLSSTNSGSSSGLCILYVAAVRAFCKCRAQFRGTVSSSASKCVFWRNDLACRTG